MISDGIDLIKFVWIRLGSQAGSDFCILTISLKIVNMDRTMDHIIEKIDI